MVRAKRGGRGCAESFTVELSRRAAEYLESKVARGEASSISAAIEDELAPAVAGEVVDRDSPEYRAFLEGAADTYHQLRAGAVGSSPLAEVRERFERGWSAEANRS